MTQKKHIKVVLGLWYILYLSCSFFSLKEKHYFKEGMRRPQSILSGENPNLRKPMTNLLHLVTTRGSQKHYFRSIAQVKEVFRFALLFSCILCLLTQFSSWLVQCSSNEKVIDNPPGQVRTLQHSSGVKLGLQKTANPSFRLPYWPDY